jgi:hypothetical protein
MMARRQANQTAQRLSSTWCFFVARITISWQAASALPRLKSPDG